MFFIRSGARLFVLVLTVVVFSGNLVTSDDVDQNRTLTLGLLVPRLPVWTVAESVAAVIVPALEKVKDLQLLPGYDVEWIWKNSACNVNFGQLHE